jgi:hypothetical protein
MGGKREVDPLKYKLQPLWTLEISKSLMEQCCNIRNTIKIYQLKKKDLREMGEEL